MSVPSTVFFDTGIFDSQNYNFDSSSITNLVTTAKSENLTLLLPRPTEQEITSHIGQRSQAAIYALKDAKRRAPFLKKSKNLSLFENELSAIQELRACGLKDWRDFLSKFNLVRLPYDGVDLAELMSWYQSGRAPFGKGKKRKEFPDAITIAILAHYARTNECNVAVVSTDGDFKTACGHYAELLYYQSIPAVTEAILSKDARLKIAKEVVESSIELIEKDVESSFGWLSFYHEASVEADVSDVEVSGISIRDIHVVGLGEADCTIAYDAEVAFTAHVEYDDPETAIIDHAEGIYISTRKLIGVVRDCANIGGSAKLSLADDWKQATGIAYSEIDTENIYVSEVPDECEYYE